MHWNSVCAPLSPIIRMKCASSPVWASGRGCCCACRSAVPVPCVICRASSGCDPENFLELARQAAGLGVDVQGISFHVGSQAADPAKHVEAIEACTRLMAAARREKLGTLDTLDIGGGFPIDYGTPVPDIQRFCAPIRQQLVKLPKRHPRHRRARTLHRRSCCHRRCQRHGPRAARGSLVVLPGRWAVRFLQRPALRSCPLSGGAVA